MTGKIYLSGDHAGFKLKEKIKKFLDSKKLRWVDFGPLEYHSNDDYPDFVMPLAKKISHEKNSRGIIIAGSGQGEAIAVNKIKGIRAALYHGGGAKIVEASKIHNNANILSFGARFVTEREAKKAIEIFLETKFAGGRHLRRIKKIDKYGQRL